MVDYGPIVKAVLFAIFGSLTAALSVVTGPTYDDLFVPEMDPANAFAAWKGSNVFATAAQFSNALLVELVDPLAVLVIAAVGFLYLARATHPSPQLAGLAPKLVLGLLVANLVLPITTAIWQVAAGVYPIFYDYGGGAWRSYDNLVGPGAINLSWDNGILAFVVSWVLFGMVLLLSFLLAFRSALVAVLLVLLPLLTLLWPIPGASSVARKVWVLFVEMTVLPCFVVVPLVLAVGSSSVLLTLGLFAVALAMPQLLSASGAAISHAGFPNTSFVVGSGLVEGAGSSQGTATGLLSRSSSSLKQGLGSGPKTGQNTSQSQGQGTSSGAGSGAGAPPRESGGRGPGGLGERSGGGVPFRVGRGALGGPAGLVAWGMQEGLGRIGRELGERAHKALGEHRARASLGDHTKGGGAQSELPSRLTGSRQFPGPTARASR